MSYVGEPFKHDIFVSYSHADVDGSGKSKLKQWSQAFERELKSELMSLPHIGGDLNIFLDQEKGLHEGLDPMKPLTNQLIEDVKNSAVLMILMSEYYLRSDWCADERHWWFDNNLSSQFNGEGYLAVARIWPTSTNWPNELCDHRGAELIGFPFYDQSQADSKPQPFEWPEPDGSSKGEFRAALLDLVARLSIKLDLRKQEADEQRNKQTDIDKLISADGQVIYLYGRESEEQLWESTADKLAGKGLIVFPGEPARSVKDPLQRQLDRESRIQTMSGCDALLLLGGEDGSRVDADMVCVGRQDRHSAKAVSNRELPCALINSAGDKVETPERKRAAKNLQMRWINASQNGWLSDMQEWLSEAGNQLQEAL